MKVLKTFSMGSIDNNTPLGVQDEVQALNATTLANYYFDKPEVLATGTTAANVTGDGTAYTLLFGTEVIDIGGNFAANAFVAPVAGRHLFDVNLVGAGITGMTLFKLEAFVNGVSALKLEECVAANYGSSEFALSRSCVLNLAAADSVTFVWTVTGGSKVADVTSTRLYARLWSL